jgi:hypothetical protein
MQQLKAEQPIESPSGSDPVGRLMKRLTDEGFTTDQSESEWAEFGEIIYRRNEQISFASGETIFIFTRVPEINERILRQTSQAVVQSYSARGLQQKALSVLQSTTVSQSDQPHNETLNPFITRIGGATFIPVVIVPDINEVLYPVLEEKVGSIRPRVEYLQYLLGERREPVNMHSMTVQAFYISVAVAVLVLIAIALSFIH